ncbi:baculoviral IAP repeat-containing protein 5.2 [Asbolus verrucosus]|uniref:Baculoviral IAP repeat-containing protein 5.2 n=1 Tax=Asbolus verrucosus TaxID=1661398 RepID=A0A482VCK7_ASBVE|nr:baculoviral IAP repeat-containing protein 5.2 [Asbolus verrucosus]
MDNEEMTTLKVELEFCFEKRRKETFKSWVFNDKVNCSAAKLAEAGFIFIGNRHEPDSVKCFLCDKHLDSWDEDDDPWTEHLKHSPGCSFVKLDKPEKTLTLMEFINIRNELIENIFKKIFKSRKDQVDELIDECVDLLSTLK